MNCYYCHRGYTELTIKVMGDSITGQFVWSCRDVDACSYYEKRVMGQRSSVETE